MFSTRLEETAEAAASIKDKSFSYLILGDSHAGRLREDIFPAGTAINFVDGSDNYFGMLAKLQYAIQNSTFEFLLLEADMHMFSAYRNNRNNLLKISQFTSFQSLKEIYGLTFSEFLNLKIGIRFPVFFSGNSAAFRTAFIKEMTTLKFKPRGIKKQKRPDSIWATQLSSDRNSQAAIRASDQFQTPYIKDLALAFRVIIQLCRENNIKIIALRYPLADEYISEMSNYDLSEVKTEFKKASFYQLWDFSSAYSGLPEYFKNADHLGHIGSIHFSTEIVSKLGMNPQKATEE